MRTAVALKFLSATATLAVIALGQTTTRETVSSAGVQGSLGCGTSQISADGRFTSFRSSSPNLVAGDTNGAADIFVHDRITGQTTRVSISSAGVEANGNSGQSDISASGRFVVFESGATNLVAGDTNATNDIFCHDRQTAQTTRVSLGSSGQQALVLCQECSISADGRFVAFQSNDNTLVPGDICLGADIFLRDRQLGTTMLVSASNTTGQTFTSRYDPRVSDDGSIVVFDSAADDLTSNDTNGVRDVFAWSRLSGTMALVSLTSGGAQGDRQSLEATVSADGRYVAFSSAATNFGGGNGNSGQFDIFVRDRTTGQTSCVSIATGGAAANGFAQGGTITDDGRLVAFWSDATNLVPDDTNGVYDCFVHDRQTATTTRISKSASGLEPQAQSTDPMVAPGGRYVTFTSPATNLVIPDTNGTSDIVVRDLEATAVALAYGTSCPGTSSIPAQAEAIGQPFIGNASFAIGVTNGFPSQLCALAVSLVPASIFYGTCEVLLGGSLVMLPTSFTNNSGFASTPFPIPANPGLAGITFYGQYLVLDPNGHFLGFAQLTQGLAITLN